MKSITVARVAVENTVFSFDRLFDYSVPPDLIETVFPGKRVLVPFGNGSKKRIAMVFSVFELEKSEKKLKKVDCVLDSEPLLTREMLMTANFIREQTFCTFYEAAKLFLPLGLTLCVNVEYKAVKLPSVKLCGDELEIYSYLTEKGTAVEAEKIISDLKLKSGFETLDGLTERGILQKSLDTRRRTGDATVKSVRLLEKFDSNSEEYRLTAKQKEIIKVLLDIGECSVRELCYFTGLSAAVISALESKGLVEIFEREAYRAPYEEICEVNKEEIALTEEQNKAYKGLLELYNKDCPCGALLYGVTGSGKTSVYLRLIDEALKTGRGIIVMIPEISLTPQLLSLFYGRYGEKTAVFHSALSLGQRMDEWKRIKRGEAQIALGTRSAVFAPFEDIGLIIMDEEQEHTYKSEMTPRYHAREVASYRVGRHNALLVLSSATPSVETYTKACSGAYSLFELKNRYGEAVLPSVEIVDTTYQSDMALENISSRLADEIRENYEKGFQTILLLNRRGYNTFASCTECGTVMTCPNCSISLTYHIKNGRLMCHYCGYSVPFTHKCPNCENESVKFVGSGTQKLEEQLKEVVPNAKVLRMDSDSTASRFSFEDKFNAFSNGDYDIMVGTQMVAKGLDFPKVTLVGVLSVDLLLFNDDYKSSERAFDLITQVVGRSGRGENAGKAIIQTSFPENEIISLAAAQDYKAFYDLEILLRREMVYPPYCDICLIGFSGENELGVFTAAEDFLKSLKAVHSGEYSDLKLIVLGPVVPRIGKVGGKFRSRIIIKCKNSKKFREMINRLLTDFMNDKKNTKISIYADINPENTL